MANLVDKVIATAQAEVDYLEKSKSAYAKDPSVIYDKTKGAGKDNITKYWEKLAKSMQGSPWCNAFVNWVFIMAYGVTEAKKLLCTEGGWSYYTPTSAGYFKKNKQWFTSNPKAGDIIYYQNSVRICHVGLVYKVDEKYVYTIEGNTSSGDDIVEANGGSVACKKYKLDNKKIAGYGRPAYDVVVKKSKYPGAFPTKTVKKGDKNTDVGKMQAFLNWYGKYELTVDNSCGKKSIEAIIDFQKKEGLTQSGEFDSATLKKAKTICK